MNLQTAKCTTCGASLNLQPDQPIVTCNFCKSQVIVSHALDFAKVEVDKSKDLVKYRDNLKKYVRNNSIEEILRKTTQVESSSKILSNTSENLQEIVSSFKIY